MSGKATLALAIQQSTASPQKPVPFVLKKIMDIPPPNILEECNGDIEKEKLCPPSSQAVGEGGVAAGDGGGGGAGGGASASLTPAIWERTIPYDGETFHLEYMDLDEFLLENGIPVTVDPQETGAAARRQGERVPEVVAMTTDSAAGDAEAVATVTAATVTAAAVTAAADVAASPDDIVAAKCAAVPPPVRPWSPVSSKPEEPLTANATPTPTPNATPTNTTTTSSTTPTTTTLLPVKLEEEAGEDEGGAEEEDGDEEEEGVEEEDEEEEEEEEEEEDEEVPKEVVVRRRKSGRRAPGRDTPPPLDPEAIEVDIQFQPDPTDLVLSSVPGGELFNPRKHKFSDEELRPQPMIKKAKKVYVPDEQKDDKYWSRRKKNNVAAKRSRDARRLKENQITVRASFLERENAALRQQVAELRKDCGRCRSSVARYQAQYGPL